VLVTTSSFAGYDPVFRTQSPSTPLPGTVHISIVTSSRIYRMVAATAAIGLRLARNITMTTYESVEDAIVGARQALAKVAAVR
jgi:hypothetical protein